MSVQAIAWALEGAQGLHPTKVDGNGDRLVIDVPPHLVATLMGLANHADQDGRGAYPAAGLIGHYTRKTQRNARKDLAQLQDLDLIRPGDQRMVLHIAESERPVVYDLAMFYAPGRVRPRRQRQRGGRPQAAEKPPVADDTPVDNPPENPLSQTTPPVVQDGNPLSHTTKTPCRTRHPNRPSNHPFKNPSLVVTYSSTEGQNGREGEIREELQQPGTGETAERPADPVAPPPAPVTDPADEHPEATQALTEAIAAAGCAAPYGGYRARILGDLSRHLAAGWTRAELVAELVRNLSGARSVPGVWARRLSLLGAPPSRPVSRPAWCGQCEERTRLAWEDDERMVRCSVCHPLAGEVPPGTTVDLDSARGARDRREVHDSALRALLQDPRLGGAAAPFTRAVGS